jgi:hypothetical protein
MISFLLHETRTHDLLLFSCLVSISRHDLINFCCEYIYNYAPTLSLSSSSSSSHATNFQAFTM